MIPLKNSIKPTKMSPLQLASKMFVDECEMSQQLFRQKNAEYGNSIEKGGVLGAVVEIIGAVGRLPMLVLKNPTHGRNVREKLTDVLRDIHNYSNIALMMINKDNWEGEW